MSENDDQGVDISNTETISENNISMEAKTVSEAGCIEADTALNTANDGQLPNRIESVLDGNESEIEKCVKSDSLQMTNVLPEVREEIDIKEIESEVGSTTNTDAHAITQSVLQANNMEIEESVKCDTDVSIVQIENIVCQEDSDKENVMIKKNIVSTFELTFPESDEVGERDDLKENQLLDSSQCTSNIDDLSECEINSVKENQTVEMPTLENMTKEDGTMDYKSEVSVFNQSSEILPADHKDMIGLLDVDKEMEKIQCNLEKELDEPEMKSQAGSETDKEFEKPKLEEEAASNLDKDLKTPVQSEELDYSEVTPQRASVTENLKEPDDGFGLNFSRRSSSSSSDAESDIILGELEVGYASGRHSQSPFQCMDGDDEIESTPSTALPPRWQSQNLETNIETRAKETGIREPDKDDLDLSLVDSEVRQMERGSGSDIDIAEPTSKLHVNQTRVAGDRNTVKSDSLMEQLYQTSNTREDEKTLESDGDTDSDSSTDSTLPCDERIGHYPHSSPEMDIVYHDKLDNKDAIDIKVDASNNLGPNHTDQQIKSGEIACQDMESNAQNMRQEESEMSTRVTEYNQDNEEEKPNIENNQISMETDSDVINSEEYLDARVKTMHDHHDRKRHEIVEEYDNVGEDEGVSGPRAKKLKGQMYKDETGYRYGVDEIYSDDQVVDAMKTLIQGVDEDKPVRPASNDNEEVPPSTRRRYDWNTHHFFPDIHDVNRFGVVWRRRGDTEGSHQYVEEEWVRDLHYFEQLKLQQSLKQNPSHKGSKMPGRTEMGDRVNIENYPPFEDSSRREIRSPRYVEKNIYVDSRLDIDSDSSSGLEESDEAPKIWYKSPLHMRRTKRREQRQPTLENKHLVISENERRARAKAYWGSPRLRRRDDGTKIRRVPRRSSAPDPTNGSGRQAKVIAPRYNSDLMHEKLLKFEELKRRRRALDNITDENVKSPTKATPVYRAHIATNLPKSVEIPEEHRGQREYVCYIPVDPLRVSRSQEDVRYEERIPLAEVADSRDNVQRGNLRQAPYYYGRHKDPKQHRRQQVVPTQVKSQYDFLSLEVMNKGRPVHLEEMHSSSPSLRRPAERFREFSSSFENIYDAVDLSMYDTPLDGRDMLEYERRQNMTKRPERKTENQHRDFASQEKKLQYTGAEKEASHAVHPAERVSHHASAPFSDPGHTSSDPRKWYGQNLRTEREWRGEEPAKKKKFDAKSLVEEEQKKFQDYKREYARRHSDLDSTSGEDRRYIMDGTRQHSELESTSGDERHSHVPPDDYEYILRKVHHQRQDAMYGESSADVASDHSSISSPREGNLSKEIDSESDGKKCEFRKCEHIRGNQSESCPNLKSKERLVESGHAGFREFNPSLPDDVNLSKNGQHWHTANNLGKIRMDQDPEHYQRVQFYRGGESSIRDYQKGPAECTASLDKQRSDPMHTEHIERRLPDTDEASDQNNVFLVHSKPPVHRFQDNPKEPLSWQYNTVYQPDSPSQDSSGPHDSFKFALAKWQQRDVEKSPLVQSDELKPAEDKSESGNQQSSGPKHRDDSNKVEHHDQSKQSGRSEQSKEQSKYSEPENQTPRRPNEDRQYTRSIVPPLNWPGYEAEQRDDVRFQEKRQQTERMTQRQSEYHYDDLTEEKCSYPFNNRINDGFPSPKQQVGTNCREDEFYSESLEQRGRDVRFPKNRYQMWWSDSGRYSQGPQTEMKYQEWTEPASQAETRYREHADPRSRSEPRYRDPMDPGSGYQQRYRERSEPSSQPEPRHRERSDVGYQRQEQYVNHSPHDRSRYREPLQQRLQRESYTSEERSQLGPMYVNPYENLSSRLYTASVSHAQSPPGRDSSMQYSNRSPHKSRSMEQIPRERRDISMQYSNKNVPKAAQSVDRIPRGQERRDPSIQYSEKSPYQIPESISPKEKEPDKRVASVPGSTRSPQRSPQSRGKHVDHEPSNQPVERPTAPKPRVDIPPDFDKYPVDFKFGDRYQCDPYQPQHYVQRPKRELDFDDHYNYRSNRQAVRNGFPDKERPGNDDKTPQQHYKLPNNVTRQDRNPNSEYSHPNQYRSKDRPSNKPKSGYSNERVPDQSYGRRPIESGYQRKPLYDERSKYPRYYEPRKPQRTRKEGYTGLYEQSPNWNTGYDPWNEQSHRDKKANENAGVSKPVETSSISRNSEPVKPLHQRSSFIPSDKLTHHRQHQQDLQGPKPPPRNQITDDLYSARRSASQQPYSDKAKQSSRIPDKYHTYKSYEDKVRGYVMRQKQSQASNQYESHVRRGREQYRSQFQTDVDPAVVNKDPVTVNGDYDPNRSDKNAISVRKARPTRRIESNLRDTRRARSLPREAHRREYEIEVSKSRGNQLSDTSRSSEQAPAKQAPLYSVQVKKSLEKPQHKYQSGPIISVRLTRSTEDLRQKDDPEPRLSVTQLKSKLFGEDGKKLNTRCFQPELAQVWDRRDRKINSIKADLFTNETEFRPPYPPQAILSTYHKDDNEDVRLLDYVSYRDGRVKKRSTINDELTDLEKTYENLDLDNEDFLNGPDRVVIPNPDYYPERSDQTYNEPNVKRLSITNVKKLEDLQQQVPNPSLEYAKKWLSGERVPGRTVDESYYVDKQELSPASFEVAQYSKSREQDTPSTVSQNTDRVSGVYGSLPRKRADDMAYRRQKSIGGSSSKTSVTSSHHPTQSYMSLSPGVTPSQSVESLSRRAMSWHARSPDPVYDDAAYRRNLQRSKSPGASDVSDQTLLAQPSPTSTDYLKPRETSPSRGRMRIRPERVADKYHDDMAYRQLRRDVEPVVAKLPETYRRRQRDITSLRTRSQSLERTAGERGSSGRHIHIQRSNSFGPSSKPLVSQERKESLSKGVAKIIDLLSDPIRRTVSEPDLTEPSVFGSYYDARGDFVSDDSRYSQYAIKPKKQQTPRTVKLRHELKSKMRLMKTSTDSGYIESESDSPSSSGTDGLSAGRSMRCCSMDSDENMQKRNVRVNAFREEDPSISKVSTFHIPVQPTFSKSSASKSKRVQPTSNVDAHSYRPSMTQPCRTDSSTRTIPHSYQKPSTTVSSGYNLVTTSTDTKPGPINKGNAEYTNHGKKANEVTGNFSEFSICLISTGKPASEEMPVRPPVSYAGDIKSEDHEYDYQRRLNYEQPRYSRSHTDRKYMPRTDNYPEKAISTSYQSQNTDVDSHSKDKLQVPVDSVSGEINSQSYQKRLDEPESHVSKDSKLTTVPCSDHVDVQPYRPTFRWPGKGVKGEKDDKPISPRTKETIQQVQIPVKMTKEDLPRESALYRDIHVSQPSVQAKPELKLVSRAKQLQDISNKTQSNVTIAHTVHEQKYCVPDVPPCTVQDQTQINLSRVENINTKNWQPERRSVQDEEIQSKSSEGLRTVMKSSVETSSVDIKSSEQNSRSFLEKMNERKREREAEYNISNINVAVTPVSISKNTTPTSTPLSKTSSQSKPSTLNVTSTGPKAPRGRVLVPLPDLIRMQEPRKKIVSETTEKSVKEYAKHGNTAPNVDNSQRVIYMSEGQEKETEVSPNRTRTVEHKFSRKVLEQKTVIVQPIKSDSLHPKPILRGPGGISPSHPQFLSHPDRFELSDGEMTDATDITLDTLVRDNQNRPSSPETLDFSCSELDNDISDVEYISCRSERSIKEYSLPQRNDPNITYTERTQRVTQQQQTSMKNAPIGVVESEPTVVLRRKKAADRDKEAEAERRLSIKELVQSFEEKSSPFMRAMAGTELKRCSSQDDLPSQEESPQKREAAINLRDMSGSDSNLYDPKSEMNPRTSHTDAEAVTESGRDSPSWRRC